MDFWKLAERSGLSDRLRRRRLRIMNQALHGLLSREGLRGKKVLDVGCGTGRDFLQYVAGFGTGELYGVDLVPWAAPLPGVAFCVARAARMPFETGFFDLVVSIGMLEQIHPAEARVRAIEEMLRVGKSFCFVAGRTRAPVRRQNRAAARHEEGWLSLPGLAGSALRRFHYVPGFVSNVMVCSQPGAARRKPSR